MTTTQKIDFDTLKLDTGSHRSPAEGLCFMPPTDDELKRFRTQTAIRENGCIEWTGSTMWKGYGRFWFRGRFVRAHRFSYELSSDAAPVLDHLCRNRLCVNPTHLEPVSTRENLMRSPIAPARLNVEKTHCPKGHPYDEANTLIRRTGGRECRACSREEARRSAARRRDARRIGQ